MRDLLVGLIVFGALPFVLARPYIGVLLWSWLGYMNPHRLTWGWAYYFPFSQVVAIVTMVGLLFSKEKKQIPWTSTTIIWLLFIAWMNVTTLFALTPETAIPEWDRAMKIQLVGLITLLTITTKERMNALIWVIVISLGFYGVKGGLFSIATGGQYMVLGPAQTFFATNNPLALALIMTLPLMRYLQMNAQNKYLRWLLMAAIALTGLAILTSQSRGAFLAGTVMVAFLVIKNRRRPAFVLLTIVAVPMLLLMMPEVWFERMATIFDYQLDRSALGRINSWWFAFNLALDHPITGGGFATFTPELFQIYAPDPAEFHDAHSIYFEVLGEHGFVGLILFLMLGLSALRTGAWVIRNARRRVEWLWIGDMAAMLQVSLIGYAVAGLFVGLAYFDLPYHLIALLILLKSYLLREITKQTAADADAPASDGIAGEPSTHGAAP